MKPCVLVIQQNVVGTTCQLTVLLVTVAGRIMSFGDTTRKPSWWQNHVIGTCANLREHTSLALAFTPIVVWLAVVKCLWYFLSAPFSTLIIFEFPISMSFQDVGKPGSRPNRSNLTIQPTIPEDSSTISKTGNSLAQVSDGILQYQVRNDMEEFSTADACFLRWQSLWFSVP